MDYDILSITENQYQHNATPTTEQEQVMGKDDFLKMLITQLNHQDPMNPMDGQEFAAQLAQFSSLEQLSQINSNLDLSLQSDLLLSQSIANNMAVGLIGREVLALGNSLTGSEQEIHFQLSGDAAEVTIEIRDTAGNVVSTLTGSDVEAGIGSLAWDHRDQNGLPLPAGSYSFDLDATGYSGEVVQAAALQQFHANGVVYEDGNPLLLGGGGRVAFSDIVQVMEAEEAPESPARPFDPLREWDVMD